MKFYIKDFFIFCAVQNNYSIVNCRCDTFKKDSIMRRQSNSLGPSEFTRSCYWHQSGINHIVNNTMSISSKTSRFLKNIVWIWNNNTQS